MLYQLFVPDSGPHGAATEKLPTAHAKAMLRRLPRFAFCWLSTTALWNAVLVAEGIAHPLLALAVFFAEVAALVLAMRLCRGSRDEKRVTWVLVATCIVLGLIPCTLFAAAHGNGDVLAFVLLTLYLAAALFFAWGWVAELAVLAVTVLAWAAVRPFLVFHTPTIEIGAAIVVGSALSLAMSEAAARSFRLAYVHWANEQQGRKALEISRDDAERARTEAESARDEALRARADAERARAEAERARDDAEGARKEAVAATNAKDQFLAIVSHELRAPISSVLNWTELLRRESVGPARLRHALDVIERNTRAQVHLIEDLLDVTRIVSGRLKVDMSEVDVSAVVRSVLDAVRPAADAKRIVLSLKLDGEAFTVRGDAARLRQVVDNLVSNAIKFTPERGEIAVTARCLGAEVEVSVEDNGIGIAPERLAQIFERFEQAHAEAGSARRQGLGLGLAIARHLVEMHGGRIEAESPGAGKGSTFRVRLPLRAGERRLEHSGSARA